VPSRPQLAAEERQLHGKAVARLRREGVLPAVIYGHGHDSQAIQVQARAFDTLRRQAGRNAIVDLKVGGTRATPVIVHGVQEHPVNRNALHVDFFVIKMTEELTVDVAVVTTGTSDAVEKQGGTLMLMHDTLRVRALPDAIPQSLELDISSLDSFDAVLHNSDIVLPEGATLVAEPEEAIARVQAPRVEEEPVVAEEGAEEGAPEETEEGAEPAAESTDADAEG